MKLDDDTKLLLVFIAGIIIGYLIGVWRPICIGFFCPTG